MGTDIHCFIDYDRDNGRVDCFGKIKVHIDYELFGILTGLRRTPESLGITLLFSPRGLPEKVSSNVEEGSTLTVYYGPSEDDDAPEGFCYRTDAERWVSDGSSKWMNEYKITITHPYRHTHSYLYVEELKEIQEQYSNLPDWHHSSFIRLKKGEQAPKGFFFQGKEEGGNEIWVPENPKRLGKNIDIAAAIAAMEALNKDNPKRSRFIFWFDS